VLEARRYLETVGDEVEDIALWRHLLAPPTVTALDTASDTADEMGQNSTWLREHASEHRGEWVALRGSALVGHDLALVALHDRLSADPSITFVKIPRP